MEEEEDEDEDEEVEEIDRCCCWLARLCVSVVLDCLVLLSCPVGDGGVGKVESISKGEKKKSNVGVVCAFFSRLYMFLLYQNLVPFG